MIFCMKILALEGIYLINEFLSDGKSLMYLGRSVGRSVEQLVGWSVGLLVSLQNEIYLDETHGSRHLNEKSLLLKLLVYISLV